MTKARRGLRLPLSFAFLLTGLMLVGGRAGAEASLLDRLEVYAGDWTVRAEHPWSGAPAGSADRLQSRCQRFTAYFACEQTVNGKPMGLIVYTAAEEPGRLHTRFIAPSGLAGGRGDLAMEGDHWTYLDKPAAGLNGPWSRVENTILDRDHIRFAEFESQDEGKTWTRTNAGTETREP